jgi:hypothetical protein
MLLLPPARAKPGLTMRLRFALPGVPDALTLEGLLVREARIDGRVYGWGVEFRTLTEQDTALLQRFVRRTLAGSAPSPATASRPSTGPGAPSVGDRSAASTDDALRPATASYPGRVGVKSYPVVGRRSSADMASGRMSSTDSMDQASSSSDLADASSPAAAASPALRRSATASGLGPPRPAAMAPPPAGTGIDTKPPQRRPPQTGRQSLPSEDVDLVEYQADQPSDPFGDLPPCDRDDVPETDPATGRRQRRKRRDPAAAEEFTEDRSSVRQLYRDAVDEIAAARRKRKKGWFR